LIFSSGAGNSRGQKSPAARNNAEASVQNRVGEESPNTMRGIGSSELNDAQSDSG